jgi:prefoldin subunit 5
MMNELQSVQSAVALLAQAGAELDTVKANVRTLAFDQQDAEGARRVLREGVERVMARLRVAGE